MNPTPKTSHYEPLTLGPYPTKYAHEWNAGTHRRLPRMVGAMYCIGLWTGDEMRGLAVVGRPSARKLGRPKADAHPNPRGTARRGRRGHAQRLLDTLRRLLASWEGDGAGRDVHVHPRRRDRRVAPGGRVGLRQDDGRGRVVSAVAQEEVGRRCQAKDPMVGAMVESRHGPSA